MNWIEIVGYIASALIAASMAMNSILRLRLLGLIGAAIFSIYGLLIHSIPVFLLNGFVSAVHLYYILQIKNKKEYFEIMTVPDIRAPFLQRFVKFYWDELALFFPAFDLNRLRDPYIFIVFRNLIPAALFIAEPRDKRTLEIVVDYVTPDFRDLQNAHFIFKKSKKLFGGKGFERFIAHSYVRQHDRYLKKMGFKESKTGDQQVYERSITG